MAFVESKNIDDSGFSKRVVQNISVQSKLHKPVRKACIVRVLLRLFYCIVIDVFEISI